MTSEMWVAVITALGAVVLLVMGWIINHRMRLPSSIQKTIREERKEYEKSLELKVTRLETELAEERQERAQDKVDCLAKIATVTDLLIARDLVIDRMRERLVALENPSEGATT